ncbi:dentin sialophosphoprotein-like [Balamuthia mandrillaris]
MSFAPWACSVCTYVNHAPWECSMCGSENRSTSAAEQHARREEEQEEERGEEEQPLLWLAPEEVGRFAVLCKEARAVTEDPRLWRRLYRQLWNEDHDFDEDFAKEAFVDRYHRTGAWTKGGYGVRHFVPSGIGSSAIAALEYDHERELVIVGCTTSPSRLHVFCASDGSFVATTTLKGRIIKIQGNEVVTEHEPGCITLYSFEVYPTRAKRHRIDTCIIQQCDLKNGYRSTETMETEGSGGELSVGRVWWDSRLIAASLLNGEFVILFQRADWEHHNPSCSDYSVSRIRCLRGIWDVEAVVFRVRRDSLRVSSLVGLVADHQDKKRHLCVCEPEEGLSEVVDVKGYIICAVQKSGTEVKLNMHRIFFPLHDIGQPSKFDINSKWTRGSFNLFTRAGCAYLSVGHNIRWFSMKARQRGILRIQKDCLAFHADSHRVITFSSEGELCFHRGFPTFTMTDFALDRRRVIADMGKLPQGARIGSYTFAIVTATYLFTLTSNNKRHVFRIFDTGNKCTSSFWSGDPPSFVPSVEQAKVEGCLYLMHRVPEIKRILSSSSSSEEKRAFSRWHVLWDKRHVARVKAFVEEVEKWLAHAYYLPPCVPFLDDLQSIQALKTTEEWLLQTASHTQAALQTMEDLLRCVQTTAPSSLEEPSANAAHSRLCIQLLDKVSQYMCEMCKPVGQEQEVEGCFGDTRTRLKLLRKFQLHAIALLRDAWRQTEWMVRKETEVLVAAAEKEREASHHDSTGDGDGWSQDLLGHAKNCYYALTQLSKLESEENGEKEEVKVWQEKLAEVLAWQGSISKAKLYCSMEGESKQVESLFSSLLEVFNFCHRRKSEGFDWLREEEKAEVRIRLQKQQELMGEAIEAELIKLRSELRDFPALTSDEVTGRVQDKLRLIRRVEQLGVKSQNSMLQVMKNVIEVEQQLQQLNLPDQPSVSQLETALQQANKLLDLATCLKEDVPSTSRRVGLFKEALREKLSEVLANEVAEIQMEVDEALSHVSSLSDQLHHLILNTTATTTTTTTRHEDSSDEQHEQEEEAEEAEQLCEEWKERFLREEIVQLLNQARTIRHRFLHHPSKQRFWYHHMTAVRDPVAAVVEAAEALMADMDKHRVEEMLKGVAAVRARYLVVGKKHGEKLRLLAFFLCTLHVYHARAMMSKEDTRQEASWEAEERRKRVLSMAERVREDLNEALKEAMEEWVVGLRGEPSLLPEEQHAGTNEQLVNVLWEMASESQVAMEVMSKVEKELTPYIPLLTCELARHAMERWSHIPWPIFGFPFFQHDTLPPLSEKQSKGIPLARQMTAFQPLCKLEKMTHSALLTLSSLLQNTNSSPLKPILELSHQLNKTKQDVDKSLSSLKVARQSPPSSAFHEAHNNIERRCASLRGFLVSKGRSLFEEQERCLLQRFQPVNQWVADGSLPPCLHPKNKEKVGEEAKESSGKERAELEWACSELVELEQTVQELERMELSSVKDASKLIHIMESITHKLREKCISGIGRLYEEEWQRQAAKCRTKYEFEQAKGVLKTWQPFYAPNSLLFIITKQQENAVEKLKEQQQAIEVDNCLSHFTHIISHQQHVSSTHDLLELHEEARTLQTRLKALDKAELTTDITEQLTMVLSSLELLLDQSHPSWKPLGSSQMKIGELNQRISQLEERVHHGGHLSSSSSSSEKEKEEEEAAEQQIAELKEETERWNTTGEQYDLLMRRLVKLEQELLHNPFDSSLQSTDDWNEDDEYLQYYSDSYDEDDTEDEEEEEEEGDDEHEDQEGGDDEEEDS